MGFLNQVNCKIIFVSSTNTGKSNTSFLYNLKNSTDELLNIVTYICDEHMQNVSIHTDATTCSCFVLNKPVFITMDKSVRHTANLFLEDSFMQEIVGGKINDDQKAVPIFTDFAINQFNIYRPMTAGNNNYINLETTLYVYVDPAYTNNRLASGTGIAIVGKLLHGQTTMIFGLEHYFLRALTGEATDDIASCVATCVKCVWLSHKKVFKTINLAIEGNSSQDSAVAISKAVDLKLRVLNVEIKFYHTKSSDSGNICYPYYILGKEKSLAFETFIKMFNSGNIVASQELVSNTIKLDADPVEYLIKQLRNVSETQTNSGIRQYSGKKPNTSDDLIIALVIATYLSVMKRPSFLGLV